MNLFVSVVCFAAKLCRISPASADTLLTMTETDLELLKRYGRDQAEDAFAEIARWRFYLVYSARLQQVRPPQLAEESPNPGLGHKMLPD